MAPSPAFCAELLASFCSFPLLCKILILGCPWLSLSLASPGSNLHPCVEDPAVGTSNIECPSSTLQVYLFLCGSASYWLSEQAPPPSGLFPSLQTWESPLVSTSLALLPLLPGLQHTLHVPHCGPDHVNFLYTDVAASCPQPTFPMPTAVMNHRRGPLSY